MTTCAGLKSRWYILSIALLVNHLPLNPCDWSILKQLVKLPASLYTYMSHACVHCSFYQRYRDVTARIKASSCPSIPPPQPAGEKKNTQEHTNNSTESTNDDVQTRCSFELSFRLLWFVYTVQSSAFVMCSHYT